MLLWILRPISIIFFIVSVLLSIFSLVSPDVSQLTSRDVSAITFAGAAITGNFTIANRIISLKKAPETAISGAFVVPTGIFRIFLF